MKSAHVSRSARRKRRRSRAEAEAARKAAPLGVGEVEVRSLMSFDGFTELRNALCCRAYFLATCIVLSLRLRDAKPA